jgi:hypothetical protein
MCAQITRPGCENGLVRAQITTKGSQNSLIITLCLTTPPGKQPAGQDSHPRSRTCHVCGP